MPNDEVRKFFDSISPTYADKYTGKRPFHKWYFSQRLERAVGGTHLDGQRILDIGAGTGALYEFLSRKGVDLSRYYACDISSQMLENSSIPSAQRFIGTCYEMPEQDNKYDAIFLLGVTTYIDQTEAARVLKWCYDHTSENGLVAVTFTNRLAWNRRIYGIFGPLIKLLRFKGAVASQDFPTAYYSQSEAVDTLNDAGFSSQRIEHLNQTFFPLTHLAPRLSILFAERAQRVWRGKNILNHLSGEFLFVAAKARS